MSATFHRKQTKPLSVARIALGESSFVPWVSLVYECIWKISVNELITGVFRTSTMATSIITNVNKCCTYVYIYIRMYNVCIAFGFFWAVPTINHTTSSYQTPSRSLGSPVHVSAMLCGCGFRGTLRPAPNHTHGQLLWNSLPGKGRRFPDPNPHFLMMCGVWSLQWSMKYEPSQKQPGEEENLSMVQIFKESSRCLSSLDW